MNHFAAVLLVSLSLFFSAPSLATAKGDDCCLCNDCDMMMKADANVYDLDEGKTMGCSDFAELIFNELTATSATCHMIQDFYQASCCMNAHLLQEQPHQSDKEAVADRRELVQQPTVPFSRRELQWTVSTPRTAPYQTFTANAQTYQTTPFYAPQNNNGNALGCTVPATKNSLSVQMFRSTSTGFSSPTSINCSTASKSGIGLSSSDGMYQVSLKCVRCSCCGTCTGIDANVCVGNNQPRAASPYATNTWFATRGSTRRFLEFLHL
jgi:hypothetical protein